VADPLRFLHGRLVDQQKICVCKLPVTSPSNDEGMATD
jgi:hypothetical protein